MRYCISARIITGNQTIRGSVEASMPAEDDAAVLGKWSVFQANNGDLFAHVHFANEADRDTLSAQVMALQGVLAGCDLETYVKEYDYDETLPDGDPNKYFESTLFRVVP